MDAPSDYDEIQIVQPSYHPPPVMPGETHRTEEATDLPLMPMGTDASNKVVDIGEDVVVVAVADVEGGATIATTEKGMSGGVGSVPIRDTSEEPGKKVDEAGLVAAAFPCWKRRR